MENLEIREATQKDCGLILHCIKGLADYVGQPEYVTATEEKLRHTLFKKENNIYVRLAFLSEQPVGFALFFETYSTFKASAGLYIEDFQFE